MITVTSEVTLWGTVQHCETPHHELAICLYEQAMRVGLEPEIGQHPNGINWVDFYADDETLTVIYHVAQDDADRRRFRALARQRSAAAITAIWFAA
jgi:hypothetical protein